MEVEFPQFKFWSSTLDFQLTLFMFVRSIRERNFDLYRTSLIALMPWFFALDHPNYSRWLSMHIRDMNLLGMIHPNTLTEFKKGHFTVRKTLNRFSAIAIDHAHEKNNKWVKGDGGVIGLTENSSELLRWNGVWSRNSTNNK